MHEKLIDGLTVREWGDPADPAILLWPGLGSNSAYFAAIAGALPGRAVAVDPPGFGRSAPVSRYTADGLVEATVKLVEACECWAIVGHSLGAYVAAGVAAEPPVGLSAAVMIDGGFLDARGMAELGMPVTSGREQLIAWISANRLRFSDWETAIRGFATMIGAAPTAELGTYVREILVEVDGEIREPAPPERMADLVLALVNQDVTALARRVTVPTLLIACGQPTELRARREPAWQRFAKSSEQIELHVADAWGHNPLLQDPDVSTRLIAEWLTLHR